MSIILDALRRGRGRPTPVPNPNAAQTDAVLQTLGYGRFNPATPLNRIKRLLGIVALGIVIAIVLWAVVIWSTQMYFSPASEPQSTTVQPAAPGPASKMMSPPPQATTPGPTSAPDGAMVGKPMQAPLQTPAAPMPVTPTPQNAANPVPPAAAPAPASKPVPPGAPNAPSAPSVPDRVVVQNSSRLAAPTTTPSTPSGAF